MIRGIYTMSNIKKYLKENYEQSELQEIAEGGLEGGISGFIYYSETCSFYDENEDEIWELLEEDADQYGYKDINSFDFHNIHFRHRGGLLLNYLPPASCVCKLLLNPAFVIEQAVWFA